jgi:hypothetical protein
MVGSNRIRSKELQSVTETRRQRLGQLQQEFEEQARQRGVVLSGRFKPFAEKINMNPKYYGHIRQERREIGHAMAREIERICGKPANWLDTPVHKVTFASEALKSPTERIVQDLARRAFEAAPFEAYAALQSVLERNQRSN